MDRQFKLCALTAALLLAGCGGTDAPPAASDDVPPPPAAPEVTSIEIPERIVLERGGFTPEGVEYDLTNNRFLVGSVVEGTVYAVANDGRMTAFVRDADLRSSVGIEVDEARNRLIVTNTDGSVFANPDSTGVAAIGIYDLDTGLRTAMVNVDHLLGERAPGMRVFINDVTVGEDGTIYGTDSFARVVYAVDLDNNPSLLVAADVLPESVSMNGIVSHPDGFLLIASTPEGALYRVPLNDPAAFSRVELPEPVNGADGMVWLADGSLAVVCGVDARTVRLKSDDGWQSAAITGIASNQGAATTGAVVGDDVYVVQPHFADPEPPVLLRVRFE
ncbi:MAG: WD40 repeat domain-containing protein [Gammaproteobacteria bacterium]|nr:WD40 repeat domain-containing protein [Gammaproteobacteria bacterium]